MEALLDAQLTYSLFLDLKKDFEVSSMALQFISYSIANGDSISLWFDL